ncbi:MAG: GNAT family N-acetyltransferase [Nitrospiraceae bacterium]
MAMSVMTSEQWTRSSAWRRIKEILRNEGIRTLWFKALGEMGYRRLLLLDRSVHEPIPDVTAGVPISISLVTQADMAEYLAFRPGTSEVEVRRRLKSGHWGFLARSEGLPVAVTWAAAGEAWSFFLSCHIQLASDAVYLYDSFTRFDVRGRAVSPALGAEILRFFRDAGYRRTVRAISPENTASLRAVRKLGYRPCGRIGHVKIGPWRRDFRTIHIHGGSHAPVRT